MKSKWVLVLVVVLVVLFAITLLSVLAAVAAGAAVSGNQVALIHLDGVIAAGGDSTVSTPEEIGEALRRADRTPTVKAIVLRVDSPGGTAAASQEIAMEVERTKKPVVVSIADVGASGGYMVSAAADEIVALPASEVGSIGVIIQLPNIQGLADKYGVKMGIIKQGKHKDMGNPFRPLTEEERRILQADTKVTYDQFIEQVAKGRDLPVAKVRELATGRVWVGTEARELGLVDRLGTLQDAIDRAGRLGKIRGRPNVVDYDAPSFDGLIDILLGTGGVRKAMSAALGASPAAGRSPINY
ncbi:MAG: signal peptide peptidase SppA [Actinobacteria bacterium]|nr:MAG: signal peptide peptidase SppA [Actinomycetota bacterium]